MAQGKAAKVILLLLLSTSAFARGGHGNFSFKGYGIKPLKPGKHVTFHMAKLPKLSKGHMTYGQSVLAHLHATRIKQERRNKIEFDYLMRTERRRK